MQVEGTKRSNQNSFCSEQRDSVPDTFAIPGLKWRVVYVNPDNVNIVNPARNYKYFFDADDVVNFAIFYVS